MACHCSCSLYEKGVHVPYEELHVPKESETLFYGAAAGDFTLASRKAWDQIGTLAMTARPFRKKKKS